MPRSVLFFFSLLALPAVFGVGEALGDEPTPAELLQQSGFPGGLIVHLGSGDGGRTAALAGESRLVHGLDTDAQAVAAARRRGVEAGEYGRVTFDVWDGMHLPYRDNLVNLVIAERLGDLPQEELLRVLAPGGRALIRRGNQWEPLAKPWPENIDQWTHYLHDASNNAVAADAVVGPPAGFQWIADPQWTRSHDHLASLSAMVSAGGRVFYVADEAPIASAAIPACWSLIARDAFSGVLLWKRPMGPWEGHLRGFRSGPTELARRLVAVEDRVYVTLGYGQPVSELDAATGETRTVFEATANALEVLWDQGMLLVVAGDRAPENADNAAVPRNPDRVWHWWPVYEEQPPQKRLLAIRADSGQVLWSRDSGGVERILPTTLSSSGGRVYYQDPAAIVAVDAATGELQWKAARAVNRRRPTWSAPTLVVCGDVLLSADRSVDALPPDTEASAAEDQWVVSSLGGNAPQGELIAFDARTGAKLWSAPCREGYNAAVDVLVAGGLVWSGDLVSARDPGITVARDLRTGEIVRQRPADQQFFKIAMGHHRCYRNKATEEYLVLGRDGIELIDVDSGQGWGHEWVRGTCQYGVMPCNGLIYSPPHSCACHIEAKLNGFNVLSSAASVSAGERAAGEAGKPAGRLERGPAYDSLAASSWDASQVRAGGRGARIAAAGLGETGPRGRVSPGLAADRREIGTQESRPPEVDTALAATGSGDWPTYRHDAARSGCASSGLGAELGIAWETRLPGGRLSAPVIGGGLAIVAAVDAHTLFALDAASGERAWSFTAGGRIDSPPTIHDQTVIFGSADGWIYCLRAADGALAWRFLAAAEDRRIVCRDQLESAWPLHGSVLVHDGVVAAVSGRTAYLDGGMVLQRIAARTGESLSATPLNSAALPDVLSSDGTSIFLRHRRFDLAGGEQPADVPHLYSPAGFLDDSWWHRTYWLYGTAMRSGWGAWPDAGNRVPAGRLLVMDESRIYGFGRLNQYDRNGSHVGLGSTRYMLYAADRPAAPTAAPAAAAPKAKRKAPATAPAATPRVATRWAQTVPLVARAMVLGDPLLFVAGPPDLLAYPEETGVHPYSIASQEAVREHEAAIRGERGAVLLAVSAETGQRVAEFPLPALPAWDGMAIAGGRLYVACEDGRLVSMQPR